MKRKEKALKVCSFLARRYKKELQRRWYKSPFKVLIATILSQRTREENAVKASTALFRVAATPKAILMLKRAKLEQLIRPAGFFRQKARAIKALVRAIKARGIPRTRPELLQLPGVGPKTADVLLCYCFNQPCIPVDVHVKVCSERLGLVKPGADYETTKRELEQLIPPSKRWIINRGFVLFGKEICLTTRPKCAQCGLRKICSYRAEQ